jgi:hypothetical protein
LVGYKNIAGCIGGEIEVAGTKTCRERRLFRTIQCPADNGNLDNLAGVADIEIAHPIHGHAGGRRQIAAKDLTRGWARRASWILFDRP